MLRRESARRHLRGVRHTPQVLTGEPAFSCLDGLGVGGCHSTTLSAWIGPFLSREISQDRTNKGTLRPERSPLGAAFLSLAPPWHKWGPPLKMTPPASHPFLALSWVISPARSAGTLCSLALGRLNAPRSVSLSPKNVSHFVVTPSLTCVFLGRLPPP